MAMVTRTAATGTATSKSLSGHAQRDSALALSMTVGLRGQKELPARIVRNASGEFVCAGRLPAGREDQTAVCSRII